MHAGSLGPVELVLILTIVVLIFGASKLTQVGGALGKSVKDFKRETSSEDGAAPTPTSGVARSHSSEPLTGSTPGVQTDGRTPATVIEYKPGDR